MSFRIRNPYTIITSDINAVSNNVVSIQTQLSVTPENMSNKGINIDDTTVALTPSSSNPPVSSNTFPYSWLKASQKITNIRTYHYDTNGAAWVAWSVQNNINVIIGITLSNYTAELNQLSADYVAASSSLKTQYNTNVIAIAVGNEETNAATIAAGIVYAKSLIPNMPTNAYYTSVLNADTNWLNSTYPPQACTFTSAFINTVLPQLEVICFNCYGGFFTYGNQQYITLENSLSWQSTFNGGSVLLNEFAAISFAIAAASSSLDFWVTETGWCSSSEVSQNPAWTNITNEQAFYLNFLGFSLDTPYTAQAASTTVLPPNKIFYFSVRDVTGGEGGAGFGLYTTASTLTAKF